MNKYHKQAIDFCEKHNIKMISSLLGIEKRDKERNYKYAVSLMRMNDKDDEIIEASYTFEFHGSIADFKKQYYSDNRYKPILPRYDVLACITKSDPGTLDNFLSEYGYSEDTKALKLGIDLYPKVMAEWEGVKNVFNTEEMLTELQEIA